MFFFGGGGDISNTTALAPSFCVLYCKRQIGYGISISYILCLPEASVSGCGDQPTPAASCSYGLQATL